MNRLLMLVSLGLFGILNPGGAGAASSSQHQLAILPALDADHSQTASDEEFQAAMDLKQRMESHEWQASIQTNVTYGLHPRNVFDFFPALRAQPAPLVIYLHGGGFTSGDKSQVPRQAIKRLLANGFAVVSANYRLVSTEKNITFPDPMLDGKRVVQYLRAHAEAFGIRPDCIALMGQSAGANIALWVAMHDDLAQPESPDPVERQSTRVSCVVVYNGQTTNDPDFVRKQIGGRYNVFPGLLPFLGAHSWQELEDGGFEAIIHEASAITHASADDPPVFMRYWDGMGEGRLPEDAEISTTIHHPRFGALLKNKLDSLGVEARLYYQGRKPRLGEETTFLLRHICRDE